MTNTEKKEYITNIVRTDRAQLLAIYSNGTTQEKTAGELAELVNLCRIDNATALKQAQAIINRIEQEEKVAQTAEENRARCQRIANEIEAYASGDGYKCPHCGEVHYMSDYEESEHEDEDSTIYYTCPHCGEDIEESELEAVSIYDALENIYNVEYRIDSYGDYKSVEIMIACGGPSIYIDTEKSAVILYWWGDSAQYPICSDVCRQIDDMYEEQYNSIR